MQPRSYRLPPLPNRRNPPIQIDNNAASKLLNARPPIRVASFSRQKTQKVASEKEIQKNDSLKKILRPSSVRVRSFSRQSANSHQSRNSSRDSSRGGSIDQAKDKINHNAKIRISMPTISAKSWAIYEMKQQKFIYGKRTFKKRQVASLTKIMNFITILELLKEHNLEPSKIKVKVSREASYINGTTAQLKEGIVLSLWELYFGMMLPSGNDAAFQIAQVGGSIVILQKVSEQAMKKVLYNCQRLTQFYQTHPQAVKIYLAQMNKMSKKINMMNSHFANPHGLSNPDNYSCAQDLCKLCTYCMENDNFRYVVCTQFYQVKYKYIQMQKKCLDLREECQGMQEEEMTQMVQKQGILKWENTNKMLKQGWSGIKTGITPNAGPCLAASVCKFINGRNLQFLVILICSKSMEQRWKQVKNIVEWVIDQKIYF